jgi:5,10-methylenetetrahydromethanopterin reductase
MHGFPVPGRTQETARRAEELGFDGLLLADSQNLVGDPFVELGVAARATSRLGLGTGIINPVTRHPAVVAAAIATVQVESGGRAVLGVGRGDSSLTQLGLAAPSTARLRQFTEQVRGYLSGADVPGDGATSRIAWIAETGMPVVPVEVAATGPRTIAVAATLADRVMFTVGAEPARLAWAVDVARRARSAAGLDPRGLRMGAYLNIACHQDLATAASLVRGSTAVFARFSAMSGAAAGRFGRRDAAVVQQIGRSYDVARHGLSSSAHAGALDDSFVARFAVIGPPAQCIARLRPLIDLGLDRIVFVPGSRDSDPAVLASANELFAREVIPVLHDGAVRPQV